MTTEVCVRKGLGVAEDDDSELLSGQSSRSMTDKTSTRSSTSSSSTTSSGPSPPNRAREPKNEDSSRIQKEQFDMDACLRAVDEAQLELRQTGEVRIVTFLRALEECMKVFMCFGGGMKKAYDDLSEKAHVLETFAKKEKAHATCRGAIDFDLLHQGSVAKAKHTFTRICESPTGAQKTKTKTTFGKCAVGRAVNRACFSMMFVRGIFEETMRQKQSFKDGVKSAYDKSMGRMHNFVVRAAVSTAFSMSKFERVAFFRAAHLQDDENFAARAVQLSEGIYELCKHVKDLFEARNIEWVF